MTATCRRCRVTVTSDGAGNDVDLMRKMDAHRCDPPELDPEDPRTGCGRCMHSTITGDWANCGGCDDCAYFHGDGPDEPMGLGPLDVLALCIPFTAVNCEDCGHVWPTGAHLTEGLAHLDECPAQDPAARAAEHAAWLAEVAAMPPAVPELDTEPF